MPRRPITFTKIALFVSASALLASLAGCQASHRGRVRLDEPQRNPEASRRSVTRGLELLADDKLDEAELAFRKALDADAFNGVAHNNLGHINYRRGKLYQAAWRFQHAADLLPHNPEPLNNLAMVLERAGRLDDAVARYADALAMQPDHPVLLGNYLRARIERGDRNAELKDLLTQLAMKDPRPTWRRWAQRRAVLLPSALDEVPD